MNAVQIGSLQKSLPAECTKPVLKYVNGRRESVVWNDFVINDGQVTPVVSIDSTTETTLDEGEDLYVKVNATDPDGISRVYLDISYNGSAFSESVHSEGGYPYEWNAPGKYDTPELLNMAAGTYVLRARAKDNAGDWGESVTYAVTVTGEATVPVVSIDSITETTLNEGENLYVLVNATDPEGISRVYLDVSYNGSDYVESVHSEGGYPYEWNAPGTSDTPELLNMAAGTYLLRAVALDNAGDWGDSATYTVTVSPANLPPYFTADPFTKPDATVGTAYSQSISAQAVDPEGGTKTFSKVAGPEWLSVNTAGTAQGTPGSADVGANSFLMKVTDNGGLSDTATVNINVVGGATVPVVSFLAPTELTVSAGTNLYVNVSATDPDGISRVYLYKDGVPLARSEGLAPYEWCAPGQNDPELQNLQPGSFVLTAKAVDTVGDYAEKSITINVVGGIPSVGSIITLKACNGKYVSATYSTNNTLIADKTTVSNYERFKVVNATNCIALQCMGNNQFVSIEVPNGSKPMVANRTPIGSYEKFELIESGGQIAIRSVLSSNYASAINAGAAPLQAIQTYVGGYEKFTWTVG